MRMKPARLMVLLFVTCRLAGADASPVLREAVASWLGDPDQWAFTQRAVEYDAGRSSERLERYDPSQSGDLRWELLAIDGKPPTDEQRTAWAKRKFRRRLRKFDSPIGEFFDFSRARILGEDERVIRFDLPLRGANSWLFPTDKVDVTVVVNKETRALEHLTARVREPFRVLLGIARIAWGKLDVDFEETGAVPAPAEPSGSAQVSLSRWGERIDFTWSDFKRITPEGRPPAVKK